MSLHQPIKMPVSVFSSEDDDAPQLSQNGAAGEIKTILKACLITGYGSTAAQGDWEMPFEDGNKAVFKSTDPRATGYCLRIDHNSPKYGDVACYESMADIDTGSGEWLNQQTAFIFYNSTAADWWLLSTSVGFILIVYHNANNALAFSFGDFGAVTDSDVWNCACYAPQIYSSGAFYGATGLSTKTRESFRVAKSHTGIDSSVNLFNNRANGIAVDGVPHTAVADYLYSDGILRLIPPWLYSNIKESLRPAHVAIAGREYLIASFGSSRYVLFLSTDYWLL